MNKQSSPHDDIRGLLTDQLAGYEDSPDRDVWAAVEAELNASPKKRKLWMPYLMVAASIALLLSMILLLRSPVSSDSIAQQAQDTLNPQHRLEQGAPQLAQQPSQAVSPDNLAADTETSLDVQSSKQLTELKGSTNSRKADKIGQPAVSPESAQDSMLLMPKEDPFEYTATVTPVEELAESKSLAFIDNQNPNGNLQATSPLSGAPIESGVPVQATAQRLNRMGKRNTLDFNELTLGDAVTFASNELEKIAASPIKVHQEQKADGEVKTYQFSFLDMKITTKSHRKKSK